MWLGERIVPWALVEGYRAGLEENAFEKATAGRFADSDLPTLRAHANEAMRPVLDEAFPMELLAGISAQFLSHHYSAEELRALRAHEESPLGQKLRAFEQRAAALPGPTPEARAKAREALARQTFSTGEQKDLEAFANSPLGRKGVALSPELAAFYVNQLERHRTSIQRDLDERLRRSVEAVLPAAGR